MGRPSEDNTTAVSEGTYDGVQGSMASRWFNCNVKPPPEEVAATIAIHESNYVPAANLGTLLKEAAARKAKLPESPCAKTELTETPSPRSPVEDENDRREAMLKAIGKR